MFWSRWSHVLWHSWGQLRQVRGGVAGDGLGRPGHCPRHRPSSSLHHLLLPLRPSLRKHRSYVLPAPKGGKGKAIIIQLPIISTLLRYWMFSHIWNYFVFAGPILSFLFVRSHPSSVSCSDGLCLVQTVESTKGLSGKICPREVQRVIRLFWGAQTFQRESLITWGTIRGQIFQTFPKDFSLFVRL